MSKKEVKRLTAKQAIALSELDIQAREVSKVLGKVDMIIRLVATAQTYRQVKVLIKQTKTAVPRICQNMGEVHCVNVAHYSMGAFDSIVDDLEERGYTINIKRHEHHIILTIGW